MRPYAPPDETRDVLAAEQADAVIVRMGHLSQAAIEASSRLKVIVKHGVGVDAIDLSSATALGIPVLIALGANAQSVAEHALALMFSAARSIPLVDHRMRAGYWDKATSTGTQLFGKTLGVVGLGTIGRILLSLVQPLRMRLLAYDPHISHDFSVDHGISGLKIVSGLNALLAESDFVSLHCPLTVENRGMIGRAQFESMKSNAFIINTARGELIDTDALFDALSGGLIAGAGLDTFFPEPPPADSKLWQLSNLVVTPHIGANTHAAAELVGMKAMEQVLAVLDGDQIDRRAVVNQSVFSPVGK